MLSLCVRLSKQALGPPWKEEVAAAAAICQGHILQRNSIQFLCFDTSVYFLGIAERIFQNIFHRMQWLLCKYLQGREWLEKSYALQNLKLFLSPVSSSITGGICQTRFSPSASHDFLICGNARSFFGQVSSPCLSWISRLSESLRFRFVITSSMQVTETASSTFV